MNLLMVSTCLFFDVWLVLTAFHPIRTKQRFPIRFPNFQMKNLSRLHSLSFVVFLVCCCITLKLNAQQATAPKDESLPNSSNAKMKNSEGTEFWLCFMRNFHEDNDRTTDPLTLELFITSNQDAKVLIEIDGLNIKRNIQIKGGTVGSVTLDERVELDSAAPIQRKAIHITSDNPIAVYGLNRRFQSTDTYLALPLSVLGKEYRAIGYNKLSQDLVSEMAVIATEDNTEVTIIPTARMATGQNDGQPYTVKLRKGDVYQCMSDFGTPGTSDLTGTLIKSNKKISVFSGHSCAYVPYTIGTCNHLVEQMPPINSWGKHFYVGGLKGRSAYTLRVLANEPRTRVFESSKLVAVLDAGEFYEDIRVTTDVQITTDKPVLVAQYSQGFKNRDSVGDPMMILVSPTQQFVKNYRIATPVNGTWDHYMNLIVPSNEIASIRLDGQPISSSEFRAFGISRYSIAQVKIDFGTHTVTGASPFGLYLYGFGYRNEAFDAYGNMGGQSFIELENIKDTLQPISESRQSKTGLVLIIRDDRNTDRGLRSVKVVYAQGLTATVPTIEEGTPIVQFNIRPVANGVDGRMVLQATDLAGNTTSITVCYTFDTRTEQYGFKICPEGEDCDESPTWTLGIFANYTASFHDADFGRAGNIVANGRFGSATGSGGFFGFIATRRISNRLALSGRLGVETIGGTLQAPDSVIGRTRDPNNPSVLLPYQEERLLTLNSAVLTFSVVAEYYINKSFYLVGGAKAMLNASKGVTLERRIIQPSGFQFLSSNSNTITEPTDALETMNIFRVGLTGGVGFTIPLVSKMSAFAEVLYTHPISGILAGSDGSWKISHVNVLAGLRFKL